VRRWREITFVNDSIATSPERAIAALRSYAEPLVLLAGGRDKHLSWEEWADLVWQRARVVVAFGEARPIIERALFEARRHYVAQRPDGRDQPLVKQVGSLEEAVAAAAGLARTGEVVLLSPGGTSFDAFDDFEERGQRFRELVAAL
jgi:UDP-N-acetylmuramoylalanine--D-glutamate ligase